MAEIRQVWVLDTGPLVAALEQGNRSVEETQDLIKQLGANMDQAFEEGAEAADHASESVEGMGDSAKKAGEKGEKGAQQFADGLKGIGVAAAAAAAAIGLVIAAAVDFSAEANVIAKQAAVVGETSEEFQKLQGVFDLLTDGSVNAQMALVRLNRSLDEAATDAGPAAEAFERLNLGVEDLIDLPAAEKLAVIGDALAEMDGRAAQTGIAIDLLGRAGFALVPALTAGGDAIRDASDQFASAGVISNELAAQSEALQDAILLLGQQFGTLKVAFLEPLIPKLTETATAIRGVIAEAQNSGAIDALAESLNQLFTNETLADANAFTDAIVFLARGFAILADAQKLAFDAAELVSAAFSDNLGITNKFGRLLDDIGETAVRLGKNLGIVKREEEDLASITEGLTDGFSDQADAIDDELAGLLDDLGKAYDDTGKSAKKATEAVAEFLETIPAGEPIEIPLTVKTNPHDVEVAVSEVVEAVDAGIEEVEKLADASAASILEAMSAGASAMADLFSFISDQRQQEVQNTADEIERIEFLLTQATTEQEKIRLLGKKKALEEQKKAQESAALDSFRATQAVSVAEASINTALAITLALATIPPPANIAFAIAAGIAGAVQIAAIASQPPPTFHTGGLLTNEVRMVGQVGEGVVTRQGVKSLGGAEGLGRLNRGDSMGETVTVINKVNNRTTNTAIHEAIRTRAGAAYDELVRTVQPKSGTRVPTWARG